VAPSLSVVFPMHNEEAYVRRAIGAARAGAGALGADFEIVVVDDGSTDRTREIAEALSREDGRIRVVHESRRRGLGATLRAGYQAARGELVLYSDADLPFDFGELSRAARLLEYQEADVLAAYRFDRTSEGLVRTLYTLVYSGLVRLLFGLRFRDVNFSFKLFRRELLDRIELRSEGSFIDAEFLVRTRNAGARIIQMGVDYFPRAEGRSTLASPGVILRILGEMARLAPGLWWGPRLPAPPPRGQ
jgi:glycosyltransferase involved in cell wall biosynthesis